MANISVTTVGLTIPAPAELWTANAQRRMHWGRRAMLTQQWRWATKLHALANKVPSFVTVEIDAHVTKTGKRKTDADAYAPVIKACIDGLVDARVLEDDTPGIVRAIRYHPAVVDKTDTVTLLLRGQLA
jgi:hypothetical protein